MGALGSRGNSSDLRRLSPLRTQDLKWSSHPDVCLRCFLFMLSHPGKRVQDTADLLTGPDKKKHQATLESIDESKLEYSGLKNGAVDLESCIGYTVRAPYIIYNAREFIKEHSLDIAKVHGIDTSKGSRKIKFTSIKNERGQTEDVVMARAGPRKLDVTYSTGVKMSEAIMEKLIRKGQTSGTFKWATAPEQHTALAFHKNFTRTPTDQQLKAKCERAVKWLADNEEGAEAAGDDEDAVGAAPTKDNAGLQMPGEDDHATPKAKAKSKVRVRSGGTRSDFDTPPAKKPRQGRLEVASLGHRKA